MAKRLRWKTITLRDPNELRRIESNWASSFRAFGPNRIMHFDRPSCAFETNLPVRDIRTLASFADVKLPQDWLWDTEHSPTIDESTVRADEYGNDDLEV